MSFWVLWEFWCSTRVLWAFEGSIGVVVFYAGSIGVSVLWWLWGLYGSFVVL